MCIKFKDFVYLQRKWSNQEVTVNNTLNISFACFWTAFNIYALKAPPKPELVNKLTHFYDWLRQNC